MKKAAKTTPIPSRQVLHLDTHRIGTLYTNVPAVRGRVPVLFHGNTSITRCLPARLQNL